jgi:hypothetical protein
MLIEASNICLAAAPADLGECWEDVPGVDCDGDGTADATLSLGGFCTFVVPAGRLRVFVDGAGASFEVDGAVSSMAVAGRRGGGGGAADWTTIAGGTSTEDFLVATGGSFGPAGSGAITATTAPWSGLTGSPFAASSPGLVLTLPEVGGDLLVRPAGGVGATDLRIYPQATGGTISYGTDAVDLNTSDAFGGIALIDDGNVVLAADYTFGIMGKVGGSGWLLDPANPSLTACTIYPRNGGPCIAGTLTVGALNVGAVNMLTWDADAVTVVGCKHFGKLSTAPTGAVCDNYFDTDLAMFCIHDGAGFVQADDYTTACE